jgi:Protein of unknown function (DUF3037)
MIESSGVEYCFLQYLPNIVRDKSVSIAAIFIDPNHLENGICTMIVATNWRIKARLLDPDVDLEMLEALLTEIRDRLLSKQKRSEMIRQMEDSFSNVVQVSQRQKCPVTPGAEIIEAFARRVLENQSEMPLSFSSRLHDFRANPCCNELDLVS